MKNERQLKILEIIEKNDIETQSQLIEALSRHGFESTQATVSRDMRELRLVKELTKTGSYRYAASAENADHNYSERLKTIFRESVTSFASAQNLVVIKTLPGLANAAGSAIDSMNISHLVGSLAGDDTLFLAMEDNAAAKQFCNEIQAMLKVR